MQNILALITSLEAKLSSVSGITLMNVNQTVLRQSYFGVLPFLSPASPRCMKSTNGYQRHTASGGYPAMDQHPVPGRVAILLGSISYGKRDKLQPFGPLARVRLYLFPRGVLLAILGGAVPPVSPNPDPISHKLKCHFPHPFQTWLQFAQPFSDLTEAEIKSLLLNQKANNEQKDFC